MTAELQKLAKALDQIERRYPAGGKRYSTIIEDPYEAGYMPFPRPSKKRWPLGAAFGSVRVISPLNRAGLVKPDRIGSCACGVPCPSV